MDEVALRAERIERAVLEDLHAAASDDLRQRMGLRLEPIGTAAVSMAVNEPAVVLDRCLGLGVEAPAEEADLAAIVACYKAAGVGRYFVQLHAQAQPEQLTSWAAAAGLQRYRAWVSFRHSGERPEPRDSTLTVRRIGREHAADFGRIAAPCFDLGPLGAELVAATVGRPRWHHYMSFDGDRPAGTGVLFVQDGAGWCDWGGTHRDFRRRGGQGVVLRQRVWDALDMGCRDLFTETGEAVEGDPQHSYNNILRAGFEPMEARGNYVIAS